MAEVALKVGNPGAGWDDGDIVCCYTTDDVHWFHAHHICDTRKATPNGDGYIDEGNYLQSFFENTHQYRIERLSQTRYRKVDIAAATAEEIENANLQLFIDNRRAHRAPNGATKSSIFGTFGSEIWYMGRKDYSSANLTRVWNAIETDTPKRRTEHNDFPFSQTMRRQFLILPIVDLTAAERDKNLERVIDNTNNLQPIIIEKRRHWIDYHNDLGLNQGQLADIADRNVDVPKTGVNRDTMALRKAKT